jgi:hypothetical protein
MDYGGVLGRAWQISWRNKGLWILGILAGCSGSGGGSGSRAGSNFNYNFGGAGQGNNPNFLNNVSEQTWIIIGLALLCLILLVVILFVVLGAIGKGGLIAAFNQADEGQKIGLGRAFSLSMTYFWRIVAIQLLVGMAWLFVLLIIGLGAVVGAVATLGIGLICIVPLLCLLVPVGVAVNVYAMLAQVAVIVEEKGIVESLGVAWSTAKARVGPLVVMTLILVVGGLIIGLLIGLPALALIAPLITGLAIGSQTSITSGIVIFGLCLVAYIPVAILLNGIVQTFVNGAWTLTYRRLTGRMGVETLPDAAKAG